MAAIILAQSDVAWRMEALYLSSADRGDTTLSRTTSYTAGAGTPRLRILAVGDSLTFGYGLVDRWLSWPAVLQRNLAEQADPGSVEVISLSWPGASLFTYRDWMTAIAGCRGGAATCPDDLRPAAESPVDAVIIGFYANDFQAGPADSVLQLSGLPPDNPLAQDLSAHEPYAAQAARELVDAAGAPVYWLPLPGIGSNDTSQSPALRWDPDRWWSLLEGSGMRRLDPTTALQVVRSSDPADLMVMPSDYHPSPLLHNAYALDARAAIGPVTRSGSQQTTSSIVTGVVPSARIDGDEAGTVSYEPNPGWVCSGALAPIADQLRGYWAVIQGASLDCSEPLRPHAVLASGKYPSYNIDPATKSEPGERHLMPYQPCAAMGAPYVNVSIAHSLGGPIRVSASRDDLVVRAIRQDTSGSLFISGDYDLDDGVVIAHEGLRSLAIMEQGASSCETGERRHVQAFSLSISYA